MKKQILFVDDEPNVLDGLRRLLGDCRETWELSFATSVDEALRKAMETDFDAVVSDVSMPVKDGFELLRGMKKNERTREVPVVMLTGLNERELKRRALDLGAADLLNKPAEREDLIARLRSVIRLKSYQDEIKAHNATLEKKVRERTRDLADSRLDLILRLAGVNEYRDKVAGNHGLKVGAYSRITAEAMGLENLFVERLFLASPLHDIGLLAVPEKVLWKKDVLTFEEWELMRQHCVAGHTVLGRRISGGDIFHSFWENGSKRDYDPNRNPILKMAAAIALTHHEWWNGKGYPNGLAGRDIPLESRVVAAADVFDELTSDRPYKKACSGREALATIRKAAGEQFDPDVYAAFDNAFKRIDAARQQFSLAAGTVSGGGPA
ncbi:MAG: response regulator [Nitrospinae bacterium]|nr:response regulator [Nitrospinota bacterium]